MKSRLFQEIALVPLTVICLFLPLYSQQKLPMYFDLGNRLIEDFQGTYEFKHMRLEFVKSNGASYTVNSSGDESPRQDRILAEGEFVYWILGKSGERWIALKTPLRRGDTWHHRLRGWDQTYRVLATGDTVSVPAGTFERCAKVQASWYSNEPDAKGPHRIVYYLAPHLGIVKREVWSNGVKEHEEVLSRYEAR